MTSRAYWIVILAVLVCVRANSAAAETQPDVNAAEIVSAPDRPNASATADVTQRGVLEVEYGFTRQWFGASTSANALNGKFRLGIAENLDVSWSADDFVTTPEKTRGFGDTVFSARYRFARQSKLRPSMALTYRIKVPTGRREVGTGYADHQVAFLTSKDIGRHHFDFNLVRTMYGGEAGMTHATGLSGAYSCPLKGRLIGLIEFSGTVHPESTAIGTAVLAYRITPRLILDAGMDFGMTDAVPRKRLVIGMTYALGRLFSRNSMNVAKASQ